METNNIENRNIVIIGGGTAGFAAVLLNMFISKTPNFKQLNVYTSRATCWNLF